MAPISSSGMPPISRGKPTARPISSLIHAMQRSSVPMSGPGIYSTRSRMARAKARISCSFLAKSIFGSPKITDLPPPWGRSAAEFFIVMARARRNASSALTSGAMRMPPMDGPRATLSMATTALEAAFRIVDMDDFDRTEVRRQIEKCLSWILLWVLKHCVNDLGGVYRLALRDPSFILHRVAGDGVRLVGFVMRRSALCLVPI